MLRASVSFVAGVVLVCLIAGGAFALAMGVFSPGNANSPSESTHVPDPDRVLTALSRAGDEVGTFRDSDPFVQLATGINAQAIFDPKGNVVGYMAGALGYVDRAFAEDTSALTMLAKCYALKADWTTGGSAVPEQCRMLWERQGLQVPESVFTGPNPEPAPSPDEMRRRAEEEMRRRAER